MSREIKFRVWDSDSKVMYYWPEPMDIFKEWWTHPGLGQYTGLKDKNGTEVYEGDILKVCHYDFNEEPDINDYSYHTVEWGGEYPAFTLKPGISDMYNDLSVIAHGYEDEPAWMEVIGNIYENPELLK